MRNGGHQQQAHDAEDGQADEEGEQVRRAAPLLADHLHAVGQQEDRQDEGAEEGDQKDPGQQPRQGVMTAVADGVGHPQQCEQQAYAGESEVDGVAEAPAVTQHADAEEKEEQGRGGVDDHARMVRNRVTCMAGQPDTLCHTAPHDVICLRTGWHNSRPTPGIRRDAVAGPLERRRHGP